METKYPLKESRVRAGMSLVRVAAAARVAIATVQRYEVAPESVLPAKRAALEVVYARLSELADREAA
jgi:predicted transcriptional regulator